MSQVRVGRWGKNLAVRLPGQVVRATGVSDGEHVEVETRDGDIVIRRAVAKGKADAQAAAEEIIAEAENHGLSDDEIHQLLTEGRRG